MKSNSLVALNLTTVDELKELDKMLSYVKDHPVISPSRMEDLIKNANLNVDIEMASKMFDKLIRDKYVDNGLGAIENRITFEGLVFIKYSGYDKAMRLTVKSENRKDRREWLLVVGTLIAGLGAFALVFWEMYKTFCLHI